MALSEVSGTEMETPLDLKRRRVPLRVVTTTYMGVTERIALDRLMRDFGAEVKIQYASVRTRLHAKAWLFRRNTGFNTAYVGSSNLSRSAMLEGVEWSVRLSAIATAPLMKKLGNVRNVLERHNIRELRP
jgi:HKD family nuclease